MFETCVAMKFVDVDDDDDDDDDDGDDIRSDVKYRNTVIIQLKF